MTATTKLSPFLFFNGRVEEAVDFYVSIFPNSSIINVMKIPTGHLEGNAFIDFELDGQRFTAVDGGPMFEFTPAISIVISCDTQEEIDYYADKLSQGGRLDASGWVFDKFGVSWQVHPAREIWQGLMELAPKAVMEAMLSTTKLDIEQLRQAAGLR